MAQQKQRKQFILTDIKNIFTYHFQPIQRLQPKFMADGIRNFMAGQKQPKQLILTDFSKKSFTYRFQPIQRLQPKFMADGIRNVMYTKHKKNSAKLRLFSVIPQQQHIQPNFMTDNRNDLTTETTQILCYSYSNFVMNRQHKQLNQMTICATVQRKNLYLTS